VRSGRALYAGISSYSADQTKRAVEILQSLGTPCLIHQPYYNMFGRWIEEGLLEVLQDEGIGCIAFSPLAQGLLTDRYLKGIPDGSRASKKHGFLRPKDITKNKLAIVEKFDQMAQERGQSLAQMAIAWVLRLTGMTSALVGASKVSQIEECVAALKNVTFSNDELKAIDEILAQQEGKNEKKGKKKK